MIWNLIIYLFAGINRETMHTTPPPAKKLTKEARELQIAIVKQMLSLATSGFGLVAALAWNEMIKEMVATYIKPYLPQGSGVISLFVYATIVTTLAVAVTLNLSKIARHLEENPEKK